MPKLKKGEYGLLAPDLVRWLLQTEPDVMSAVRDFIMGKAKADCIDVAGPCNDLEIAQALQKGLAVPLPTVQLRMRMVKDNLTGDPGVEVRCSDAALEELNRWRMMTNLRKARTGQLHRA